MLILSKLWCCKMNPANTERPSPPIQWPCGHQRHSSRSIDTAGIGDATIRSASRQSQNPATATHMLWAERALGETDRVGGAVRCAAVIPPKSAWKKCHVGGTYSVLKEGGRGRHEQNMRQGRRFGGEKTHRVLEKK